jgi:hypothetical protein
VWRQTSSIGCAMFQRKDKSNEFFAVCFYHPWGNINGNWNQNVFHPSLCGQRLISDKQINKFYNNNNNNENDVILQMSQNEDVMLEVEERSYNVSYDNDTILGVEAANQDKWGPLTCDGVKYICQLKEPMDKFNIDCLKSHNVYRVKHRVPLLRISKKVLFNI